MDLTIKDEDLSINHGERIRTKPNIQSWSGYFFNLSWKINEHLHLKTIHHSTKWVMFHRKLLDEKKAGVLFGEGKMVMVDGMNRINSSIFWCSPKRFVRRKMAWDTPFVAPWSAHGPIDFHKDDWIFVTSRSFKYHSSINGHLRIFQVPSGNWT